MHAWEAVDLRIYLAQKNHGYSISAQSYDFCPRLIKLDILDFTLSPIRIGREILCLPHAGFFIYFEPKLHLIEIHHRKSTVMSRTSHH